MGLVRTPVLLVVWLGSAGCAPLDSIGLPSEGARSAVLVRHHTDGSAEILAADLPSSVLSTPQREPVLVFTFDRPLVELGLAPGVVRMGSLDPRRDPVPAPLARYAMEVASLERTETTTSGLELPQLDLPSIFRKGHCLEPAAHVSTVCGSSLSLDGSSVRAAAGPNLLSLSGRCPEGWQSKELRIARGASWGERVVAYCEPPLREACTASSYQGAADARCSDSTGACPPGDFAERLPNQAIRYVLEGALGGDGSRVRPFGSLSQATNLGGPLVIALGKGQYRERVILRSEVELVGACAAQTQILGTVWLRGHRGSIRGLSLTATGAWSLIISEASEVLFTRVAIAGAVRAEASSKATFFESRIGGPKLEASDSEVSLRSSELNASVDVERSSLSAEGTALSATAAGSRISATDSELSFLRSRVDLGVRGDPGSAISAEQSWFTQVHPSTGLSRDLLRARGPLTVRQCTFAMPEVLVTAQEMMGPTRTQFALVASGARAEVEDVLVLLARQDSYANFAAVVMANADASEPYHLRRGLVIGGTRQAQVSVIGRADMEDWAGYDGVGHAISVDGGDIVLTRVEGARNESVVQLSASEPLLARLRDLRTFDCPTGLIVRSYGGSIDADISRIHLSGLRADGSGLSIRADAADGELAGPVRVVMRDVLVDAEVTRSMELGMDAVLDLQDFRFVGASYGIALRHRDRDQRPPHPHHLRRGSIHANLAGVLLSDLPAELHRLLDQVQVNATLPVLDPDPQ